MRINKVALLIAFAITSVLFMEVVAHADEADQYTKITFNQAIEIPGKILPAGTYLFKLENPDNLSVVQIRSADGTHTYATLQTIAAERGEPTADTVVVLAEQPNGLGGQLKTGQLGSLQNRPTGVAQDVILFIPFSPDQASPFSFSNSSAHI